VNTTGTPNIYGILSSSTGTVSIQNNNIGDDGATQLADALKSNNIITAISLDRNKIGGMGVIKLANALKENRTVESLDLFSNMFYNTGSIRAALQELQIARPGLRIST
jgi:Ran GTPase-activating protein (RanGAP) involved in mRNA processing and transport